MNCNTTNTSWSNVETITLINTINLLTTVSPIQNKMPNGFWKQVSSIMNRTGEQCRNRFRTITENKLITKNPSGFYEFTAKPLQYNPLNYDYSPLPPVNPYQNQIPVNTNANNLSNPFPMGGNMTLPQYPVPVNTNAYNLSNLFPMGVNMTLPQYPDPVNTNAYNLSNLFPMGVNMTLPQYPVPVNTNAYNLSNPFPMGGNMTLPQYPVPVNINANNQSNPNNSNNPFLAPNPNHPPSERIASDQEDEHLNARIWSKEETKKLIANVNKVYVEKGIAPSEKKSSRFWEEISFNLGGKKDACQCKSRLNGLIKSNKVIILENGLYAFKKMPRNSAGSVFKKINHIWSNTQLSALVQSYNKTLQKISPDIFRKPNGFWDIIAEEVGVDAVRCAYRWKALEQHNDLIRLSDGSFALKERPAADLSA